MKIKFKYFLSILLDGGITKKDYQNIKLLCGKANLGLWKNISLLMSVAFCVLSILTIFIPDIRKNWVFYLPVAVYATSISLAFFFFKENNYRLIKLVVYTTSAITYAFGIFLGTSAPTELTVSFMVMLVALPLIIIDKPWRIILLNLSATIAFIVATIFTKDERILIPEIFDALVYMLLSAVLTCYHINARFNGFLKEYHLSLRVHIDALTGLGSEYAYLEKTAELNEQIKNGTCENFAVVMMDLNNVKTTNDTYGHVYGCSLIVESAHYIRTLFQKSHTFHIGGDEFIAILVGGDYENRDKLLEQFDRRMEDYYYTKDDVTMRIVLARGISVYEKDSDKTYKKVLKRADNLMYENKKYVKALYNMPQR